MSLHKDVSIGHIHLTVSSLEKSLAFYRDILGFEVTSRHGTSAVFLSAGGYHHHIGLNTWSGEGVSPQPAGYAGIYHFAILYPTRKELAKALDSLLREKYPLEGASDHGVSEAIYLRDPDNIGIELYVDRLKDKWEHTLAGDIVMETKPLDIKNLLLELKR